MSVKWEYCTLEEYTEGDAVHAPAVMHEARTAERSFRNSAMPEKACPAGDAGVGIGGGSHERQGRPSCLTATWS